MFKTGDFLVYALLGTGIALFVISRAPIVSLAAVYGALFGLVVYGVYGFTNHSTLWRRHALTP